jgi:DNA-directed RNA polymerase sigma subunit (sigma70/sigma32)
MKKKDLIIDYDFVVKTIESKQSLSVPEFCRNESLKKEINRSLNTLTDKEIIVINKCFGLNGDEMTLEEIAKEFDSTRERIRGIKEKALRRLRHTSRSKLLKDYLCYEEYSNILI